MTGASESRWYRDAVIYEVPVKAFADSNGDGIGDFRGLISKLDYLQDLGVTALWLLPFYPSPLKDDGYDTADYTTIHPDLGTMRDFETFVREAHARDLRVISELVLNHTSDQHPWFQRAREAPQGSPERDFYVWSDTPGKYADARIIFQDFETSNWTWDPVAKAYFWHRFYAHQPDLNWDNPAVVKALYEVVDFWFDLGVDGLRLDAVPYLFEREGTNCENLPETHAALRDLRAHVDANHADKMLLAEANMWPEEVIDYFGGADSGVSDECHMAFHFPLMPRMFMAIRMEDRFPIVDILHETPELPEGAQWATFLRNHDELTLEMVTDEERDYMWRIYAADSRARINLGIRRRLAPLLGNNRRLIELMNSMLLSLPGTPVLYYGDEIGMGDNVHLGDRDGVRTPMQWNADRNAGFSQADPHELYLPVVVDAEYQPAAVNVEVQRANPESLWWSTKRTIATRKRHPALGSGALEFLPSDNPKVLTYLREGDGETILCVANLSRFAQPVQLDLARFAGATPVSVTGGVRFPEIGDLAYMLTLGPHDFVWLALERAGDGDQGQSTTVPTLDHSGAWTDLLTGGERAQFEALLPAHIAVQRWFRDKERRIGGVQIVETMPVGGVEAPAGVLAIVRVEFTDGDAERYVLPLACRAAGASDEGLPRGSVVRLRSHDHHADRVIFDGLRDDEFASALLDAVRSGSLAASTTGTFGVTATAASEAAKDAGAGEAPWRFDAEQTNSTVAFGDRYVLKLFRRLDDDESPDVELGTFLTEGVRFDHAPALVGSLSWRTDDTAAAASVAVLHRYIPSEGDAWRGTLDALGRYFDDVAARTDVPDAPPLSLSVLAAREPSPLAQETVGGYLESARLLGERTAELHLALARAGSDEPAIEPVAMTALYRRSLYQGMRSSARRTLQSLRRSQLAADDPVIVRLLEHEEDLLERFRSVLDIELGAPRIRCHGDFHLGQLLWTGRDFFTIDFEGEPARPIGERRIKRSPLTDVASMVRSLHYAASIGYREAARDADASERERLARWGSAWYAESAGAYLRAYLAASDERLVPTQECDVFALLDAYVFDKALYELRYELANRPQWLAVPARGILNLLGDGGW